MKILVTGAYGQLGREIMSQSRTLEHQFVFTDLKGDGVDVLPLDITVREQVLAAVTDGYDVIINCAAYTDVERSEDDPDTAYKVNEHAVRLLAEAAAQSDALLMHISTDYVFDGKSSLPYCEDAAPAPLNVYGKSKLSGEEALIASGCRYMIFRTSWLYSLVGKNFFLTMAEKTASRPELKVVYDQVGTPTCAYDLAYLLLHIIEADMLDKTGIYNYSNEGVCSWYDFAKAINAGLGHLCRIVPCRSSEFPVKAQRPSYSVLDKTKVKRTFGIEIPHWRESLEIIIREIL